MKTPGLRQGKNKMNLGCLIALERKEVIFLKNYFSDFIMSNRHRSEFFKAPIDQTGAVWMSK